MTLNTKPNQPAKSKDHWPTFWEILQGLHREGILIHPEQLAEFFLCHGLPVDLCYVPEHLQQKAQILNANYRGDMARLSDSMDEYPRSAGEVFFGHTISPIRRKRQKSRL